MRLWHMGSLRPVWMVLGALLLVTATGMLPVAAQEFTPTPPPSSASPPPSSAYGPCDPSLLNSASNCIPNHAGPSTPPPSQSEIAAGLKNASAEIEKLPAIVTNDLFRNIPNFFDTFVGVGQTFLGIAFLLSLLTLIYTFWVKGGSTDFIFALMRLMVLTAIPLALLGTVHGSGFWPFAPERLVHAITGGMSSLLDKVGGGGIAAPTGGASGQQQVGAIVTDLMQTLTASFKVPTVSVTGSLGIVHAIVESLLAIVLFVPFVIFALALMFALYGPLLLIDIGVVMGPLLIPWIVWDPFSNFAMTWLKYMLTMCMAYLVGILMGNIVILAAGQMLSSAFSATTVVSSIGDISLVFPGILMLLFMGYMLFKAEAIAAGLIGGPHIGSGGVLLAAGIAVSRMMTGGIRGPGAPNGTKAQVPGLPGPAGAKGGGGAVGAAGAAGGAGGGSAGSMAGGGGGSVGGSPGGGGAAGLSNQARDVAGASGSLGTSGAGGSQAGGAAGSAGGPALGGAGAPEASAAGAASVSAGGAAAGGSAASAPSAGAPAAAGGRWGAIKSAAGSAAKSSASAMHKGYLYGRDRAGRGGHGMHLLAKSTAIGAAAAFGGPVGAGAVAAYVLSRHARGVAHSVANPVGHQAMRGVRAFLHGKQPDASPQKQDPKASTTPP